MASVEKSINAGLSSLAAPSSQKLESLQDGATPGDGVDDDDGPALNSEEQQLSDDLAQFLSNPSLQAALADGSLDLASYSSTVQRELADLESECIAAYRSKAKEIAALHGELGECDDILVGLQEMLLGFQADLGGLSGDLRHLQETSKDLGVKLGNRKAATEGLRDFLQRIVLSPQLAHTICTGPINRTFANAVVKDLDELYKNTHDMTVKGHRWSCGHPPASTVAGHEMQAHVGQLRTVAIARTREYFLRQLDWMKPPHNTNLRMIQSHGLVPFADLYDFLLQASPPVADELFQIYTERMSKTLYALFRTYQAQLLPLDATRKSATRHDVLAMEDAYLRDTITTKVKKRVDVFTLGTRASDVLRVDENSTANPTPRMPQRRSGRTPAPAPAAAADSPAPIIIAHVARSNNETFPYERLYQSCLVHLLNAVTNEYVVCRQFFQRDAFAQLFTKTTDLLQEQLETYLFSCHDAICLLLLIKVTHQVRRLAHQRTVNSLNRFFDKATRLIWPRLSTVMQAHIRSIQQATATTLGGVDLHAHYISRRVAEFTCSLLLILSQDGNGSGPADKANAKSKASRRRRASELKQAPTPTTPAKDPENAIEPSAVATKRSAGDELLEDLSRLLVDFVALLNRLSEEHKSNKSRIVFMINNLDQIRSIFVERRVEGRELNKILEALMAQRELFVEEELLQGFSKMIAFVQQTESHMHQNADKGAGKVLESVNSKVVESLVREFSQNWRKHMEQINRNVLSYFSNFRNGMEILKQVLTQLLLYYTRFQDVLRKLYLGDSPTVRRDPPPFFKDLIPTTVILAEIKKFALAI